MLKYAFEHVKGSQRSHSKETCLRTTQHFLFLALLNHQTLFPPIYVTVMIIPVRYDYSIGKHCLAPHVIMRYFEDLDVFHIMNTMNY